MPSAARQDDAVQHILVECAVFNTRIFSNPLMMRVFDETELTAAIDRLLSDSLRRDGSDR